MTYIKPPTNLNTVRGYNIVIGHYKEYAIIENELHHLFFVTAEENELPIGTIADDEILLPLCELPAEDITPEDISKIQELFIEVEGGQE